MRGLWLGREMRLPVSKPDAEATVVGQRWGAVRGCEQCIDRALKDQHKINVCSKAEAMIHFQ